jgi:RNA polymerase sigma-70 factor, ECF subfamily
MDLEWEGPDRKEMRQPEALAAKMPPSTPTTVDDGSVLSQRAFELQGEIATLYEAEAPGLLRFATLVARQREIASDSVQEVFLRYFLARQQGESIAEPRLWLFRTLQDCLRGMTKGSDDLPAARVEGLRDTSGRFDPASGLDLLDLGSQLASSLTERELACLVLKAEGLRYREIAEVLDIQIGTVAAFLNRAVKKAKAALGEAPSQ